MSARLALRKGQRAAISAWPYRGGVLPSLSQPNRVVVFPVIPFQSISSKTRSIVAPYLRQWRLQRNPRSKVKMAMQAGLEGSSSSSRNNIIQNNKSRDALVWIDCEMTGLDLENDEILEVYCILTDGNLNIIDDEGFHAVIHFPKSRLDQMDEWCTTTHRSTGLTAAVLASTTTTSQAADALYDYITRFIPERRTGLLAGSSVHVDKEFLRRGPFGKVIEHLHYRILDVSTIKEAAWRWSPPSVVASVPRKVGSHKARDDILESIAEAKYYRDAIFRCQAK